LLVKPCKPFKFDTMDESAMARDAIAGVKIKIAQARERIRIGNRRGDEYERLTAELERLEKLGGL